MSERPFGRLLTMLAAPAHPAPTPTARRALGAAGLVALGAAGTLLVTSASTDAAAALARAAGYGGALVAVGIAGHLLLVDDGRGLAAEAGRLRWLLLVAVAVGVAGAIGQVAVQVTTLSGRGWTGVFDAGALADVAGRRIHVSAAVRALGLTQLAYAVSRPTPSGRLLLAAGAITTLASFLVAGHAATREPRLAAVVADLAHTGGAALWTGGLVSLAVALRARRGGAAAMVQRFSRLMVGVLVVLLASAGALTWLELDGDLGAVTATDYGAVLLAKAGLVAVLLGVGGHNHRRLVPGTAWAALRRTVTVELALIAAVVLLTGVLTGLDP